MDDLELINCIQSFDSLYNLQYYIPIYDKLGNINN